MGAGVMRGIYLTTAANDRDLVKAFALAHPGVSLPIPIKHGDFMFDSAQGWHCVNCDSGVQFCGDRKKVPDLLTCIDDGRHLNQIRSAYEAGINRQCLIVEGLIKEGPDGEVIQRKGARETQTTYKRLKAYLYQLHYMMNVQVIYTRSLKETVREIYHLWSMFQTPPDDHDSLKKFYVPPMPSVSMKPSVVRRVAKELNYVEWERSKAIAEYFGTIQKMANASEEEWMEIPGLGKVIAHSAVKELQG